MLISSVIAAVTLVASSASAWGFTESVVWTMDAPFVAGKQESVDFCFTRSPPVSADRMNLYLDAPWSMKKKLDVNIVEKDSKCFTATFRLPASTRPRPTYRLVLQRKATWTRFVFLGLGKSPRFSVLVQDEDATMDQVSESPKSATLEIAQQDRDKGQQSEKESQDAEMKRLIAENENHRRRQESQEAEMKRLIAENKIHRRRQESQDAEMERLIAENEIHRRRQEPQEAEMKRLVSEIKNRRRSQEPHKEKNKNHRRRQESAHLTTEEREPYDEEASFEPVKSKRRHQ
jgi:hypothetical protein